MFAGEIDDLGIGGEGDAWHDDIGFTDNTDLSIGDGDDGVLDGAAADGVGGGADEQDGCILGWGGVGEVLGK